jgi:hypothetical protein
MRLDDLDQMKRATAIVERVGADLRFAGHKRLVFALDNADFMASLRQACPDRTTASALIKEARASPNRLLQLRGADTLALLLRQSIQADWLVVAEIARRLREAAQAKERPSTRRKASPHFVALETGQIFGLSGDANSFIGVFWVPMVVAVIVGLLVLDGPFGTALGECVLMLQCMKKLQKEWSACLAKARQLPPGNRKAETDQAALEAQYAADFLQMPLICANFALNVGTRRTTASPSAYPSFTCYGLPTTFVPIDPTY